MSGADREIDSSIRAMIEKNSREAMCRWCHPDENGQYSAAKFESPDQKSVVMLFFGGAGITVDMNAGTEHALLKLDINYCPMCGRNLTAEGEVQ